MTCDDFERTALVDLRPPDPCRRSARTGPLHISLHGADKNGPPLSLNAAARSIGALAGALIQKRPAGWAGEAFHVVDDAGPFGCRPASWEALGS